MKTPARKTAADTSPSNYAGLVDGIGELLEAARRASARAVNALMTATYWEIGRRIVEFEQHGRERADYGETLLPKLSADLARRFGRGFSADNLESMRLFYSAFPPDRISETLSRKSSEPIPRSLAGKSETMSRIFDLSSIAEIFPLSWSHYVHLIRRSRSPEALAKYALEGLPNKVLAREYKLALPNEKLLAKELEKTRKALEARRQ